MTPQQLIIEIADYIYENPTKNGQDVVKKFAFKYDRTERTIYNYFKSARQYNQGRLERDEKAKEEARVREIQERAAKAFISRNELLEFYAAEVREWNSFRNDFAGYKIKRVGDVMLLPQFRDAALAAQEIAKLQGYYEQTHRVELVKNLTKIEDIL